MNKKKNKIEHKMEAVSHCGYEFNHEERTAKLAPYICQQFNGLQDEKIGLQEFIAASNHYLKIQFTRLAKEERKWWEQIKSDIPDFTKEEHERGLEYQDGIVSVIKKEEPAKP